MAKGEIKGYATGLDGNRYALRMGTCCFCHDCCFYNGHKSCYEKRLFVFGAISCQNLALKYFKVDASTTRNYFYELCSNKSSNLDSWKKLGGK